MALITTAWLMGSEPDVPATTISVTANAVTEDIVLPAGDYYPWNGLAANSALNQLHNALESHSEITSCSAYFGRDRLPRFTCDIAYSIDSWSDLTIRNLLGFAGSEAFSATTHTPVSVSNYLWSPGRPEIPDAPLGSQGLPYHDTQVGMSGDATVTATTNNSGRKNSFRFHRIYNERYMTALESPGEYCRFWDLVVRRFYRFKLYRNITEEDSGSDSTAANLLGEVLGPYVWDHSGLVSLGFVREETRVELWNTLDLPVILTSEY